MSRVSPPPSSERRPISPSPRSRPASWLPSRVRAIAVSAVTDWTVETLSRAIAARKISPVEATQACLGRIERLDGRLHAFITVDAEGALAAARALEAELAAGHSRGPLHGVPLAYKDLCHVPGLPTSCGTKTREYFPSSIECTAVTRLREAGAVTLGKLNMTELAMGPFGDNAHHGDVQNPWKLGHCAGGSSSGSAAAVAAGFALATLGSDTGGSIRLPAACCGVVGLKPTYGRVSRAGAMPLSWSMDHLGPLTRTVADAALILEVVAGQDPHDATSSRRGVPYYQRLLESPVAGLRVGIPENHYFDGIDPEMDAAVRAAAGVLAGLGALVAPVRVPDPRTLIDIGNVISRSEAAAVHARIARERPHELQPAVRARLEIGFHITAHDYLQALRLRSRYTRAFVAEVFAETDALLAPVIPEPAPALDAVKAGTVEEVVARMGRFSRLTRPFNGLGFPRSPCRAASHRAAARSRFRSSVGPSTRRPCSASATRTSGRPTGSRGARRSSDGDPSIVDERSLTPPRLWTVFAAYLVAFVAIVTLSLVAVGVLRSMYPDVPDPALFEGLPGLIAGGLASSLALLLTVLLFNRPLEPVLLRLVPGWETGRALAVMVVGMLALGQSLDSLTMLAGLGDKGTLAAMRGALADAVGPELFLAVFVIGERAPH